MPDKNTISDNRDSIMGVAAFWVMLFHSTLNMGVRPLDTFFKIGYIGVDIFAFMSGFSMWNSYHYSCKNDYRFFLKRRLKKIISLFLPFSLLYLAVYCIQNYNSVSDFCSALFSKDFWLLLILFRWFIPFIIFCYLITPIINFFFSKCGYNLKYLFIICSFCILLTIPFVLIGSSVALMFLLRIPEYTMGWYIGGDEKETRINDIVVIIGVVLLYFIYYVLLICFSDSFLSDTGLYWWPIMPTIFLLVVGIGRLKLINNRFFRFMGNYSLELYLWHVYLLFPLNDMCESHNILLDRWGVVVNIIAIVSTCIVSVIYRKVVKLITGKK